MVIQRSGSTPDHVLTTTEDHIYTYYIVMSDQQIIDYYRAELISRSQAISLLMDNGWNVVEAAAMLDSAF